MCRQLYTKEGISPECSGRSSRTEAIGNESGVMNPPSQQSQDLEASNLWLPRKLTCDFQEGRILSETETQGDRIASMRLMASHRCNIIRTGQSQSDDRQVGWSRGQQSVLIWQYLRVTPSGVVFHVPKYQHETTMEGRSACDISHYLRVVRIESDSFTTMNSKLFEP